MGDSNDKGDVTLPLGVYVPPIITTTAASKCDGQMLQQHSGYVRIPDAKGRSICGFSRPIRTITETITVNSKKRGHEFMSKSTEYPKELDLDNNVTEETAADTTTIQQKRTITEERIHPEEALFLHMRGLLRIECNDKVMTTEEMFCKMLPESKISLPAYLAYAHLRAQGYILIRYSTERIGLLMAQSLHRRAQDGETTISTGENNETNNLGDNTLPENLEKEDRDNNSKFGWRQTKQKLSDDIAAAPPPRVVLFDEWNDEDSNVLNTTLAYFAYNPNSNFRRSDPGLPDFGLAIMPFHSSGASSPTFDTISALVALCENKCMNENSQIGTDKTNEIPLRIATVADCGAVIVYGVTRGDVPIIAKDKKDKE